MKRITFSADEDLIAAVQGKVRAVHKLTGEQKYGR